MRQGKGTGDQYRNSLILFNSFSSHVGPRGVPMEPRGLPEYRPRGLLRTPRPDRARFPGPHRGGPPRGRFHPPGGPRLRHPMPGQRMPAMGRGGMPNRFPGPDGNRVSLMYM